MILSLIYLSLLCTSINAQSDGWNVSYTEILNRFNLQTVYSAFIPSESRYFERRIQAHLSDYVSSGLCRPEIPLTIVISVSSNSSDDTAKMDIAVNISRNACSSATIKTYFQNWYEYFGIMEVWRIAQGIPKHHDERSLILYFHSKGMTSDDIPNRERHINFKVMFKYIIFQWKIAVNTFENSLVNKAGIAASHEGFEYGNFWWARASYLKSLVCPVVHNENRWYFEDWLSYRRQYQHELFKCDDKQPSSQDSSLPSMTMLNVTEDFICPCSEPHIIIREPEAKDTLTLCPPGTPLGESYPRFGPEIPCWDKETLKNGTVNNEPDKVVYTLQN